MFVLCRHLRFVTIPPSVYPPSLWLDCHRPTEGRGRPGLRLRPDPARVPPRQPPRRRQGWQAAALRRHLPVPGRLTHHRRRAQLQACA